MEGEEEFAGGEENMPVSAAGGAGAMPATSASSSSDRSHHLSVQYKKIVHFSEIKPPAVICVALGNGGRADEVRKNVASVSGLTEGQTALFFV